MSSWLTGETTYEGFPLLLRRPADFDINTLRPLYPNLAVVTHEFTKRQRNGLPESEYNHGLEAMDGELVAAFDVGRMGVAALVETYGGERNYYYYVVVDADVPAVISTISRRHPAERLTWSVRPDPTWNFIERYAEEHF
jgi:hypothetical protein